MRTTLIIYAFAAILCSVDLYGQSNARSYKTFRDSTFELGDKILAPTIAHALSGGMHVITEHEDSVKLIGDFLAQHPDLVIELGGYTDDRGSEQQNLTLSEYRVTRIKDLLVAKFNVHPDRVEVRGYGESDPIVPSGRIDQARTPNEKEELHALNRRIEIRILGKSFGRPPDGLFAHLHSFGQSDSIFLRSNRTPESPFRIDSTYVNHFVLNGQDTMFFSESSTVFQCDHLVSRDRSHDHCRYYADGLPMEGSVDMTMRHEAVIETYSGTLLGGYYETGTYLRRAKDGSPVLTGQYLNNWKFGYWTSFSPDGKIEGVYKFIDGADGPVISWEYDATGKVIEVIDEEVEIRDRMNKNGR